MPSFFISHFKPALTGSIAYAFIQRGDDYFVLLNKQKRCFPNGLSSFVADLPCGFYNVRQNDLAHTQRVVQAVGQAKRNPEELPLTHQKIYTLASEAKHQSSQGIHTEDWSCPLIDITTNDTALRELFEETGYIPKNKQGTLINHESINAGAFFYFRYLFVDCIPSSDTLPELKPAHEEGIVKSCWVNVRDIEFATDVSGQIVAGWASLDGERLELKPWDKTAVNLAYLIGKATNDRYGVSKDPGQSYEATTYGNYSLN